MLVLVIVLVALLHFREKPVAENDLKFEDIDTAAKFNFSTYMRDIILKENKEGTKSTVLTIRWQ
jgi:hypothetical protein